MEVRLVLNSAHCMFLSLLCWSLFGEKQNFMKNISDFCDVIINVQVRIELKSNFASDFIKAAVVVFEVS